MNDSHLIRTAKELAEAMNRLADDNLPTQLAGIVKLHAGLAVGSAFIPIPGADMAAAAVNIWTMYVRINKELQLPFGDNIMKSLAAGVATNLAGALAGAVVVGSALKFLPGLGTIGGAVLMGGDDIRHHDRVRHRVHEGRYNAPEERCIRCSCDRSGSESGGR